MLLLEVSADCHALSDTFSVIELEHRNSTERILTQEGALPIRSFHDVDLFEWDLDSLLCQKNPYAAWIRREFVVVDFHSNLPLNSPNSRYAVAGIRIANANPWPAPNRLRREAIPRARAGSSSRA